MMPPNVKTIDKLCAVCKNSQSRSHHAKEFVSTKLIRTNHINGFIVVLVFTIIAISIGYHDLSGIKDKSNHQSKERKSFVILASGHIVLTKDDHGSSLVLTGENGKGGKGKGGGGDQLVIAGHGGSGSSGDSSNMVMQDAANREGDVVINGNSMIIPNEDGHIVLADNRNRRSERSGPSPALSPNLFAFWLPFMNGRMAYGNWPFYNNVPFGK